MGSHTRVQASILVASAIRQFEYSIDQSLIDGADAMANMLRARQDARVAASVGHGALEDMFAACTHAMNARNAAVRGHAALDQLRKQLKLPEVADGGKLNMPDPTNGCAADPSELVEHTFG